jgi:predicted RNA-binding protein
MCESAVYLVKGSERTLVMSEAARIVVHDGGVTCVDTLGDRKEVPGARISEANLVRHEILLTVGKG